MKKEMLRVIILAVVTFVIYNLIVFIIPFVHTAVFWLSYVFTLGACGVVIAAIYYAFIKNPGAQSRFYRFPIARLAVIYGGAQLIGSMVMMAFAWLIPWWIPTVIYALGFGMAVIGLVSAEVIVEEIQIQDAKLKKDVSLMRSLQSQINHVAAQTENKMIRALAEEFRYSDPVSNAAIVEIEEELVMMVEELKAIVGEEEEEAIDQLCRKIKNILGERNRLCKLSKN